MNIMKRAILFLLALVLFVPSALADTDSEIVFHGIPWGISANELVEQLTDRQIPAHSSSIESNVSMEVWTYNFGNSYEYAVDSSGCRLFLFFYSNPGSVKIAGHPVGSIRMYAHYGIVDNAVSFDVNDSSYYLSTILFDVSDEMAVDVYADLSKKTVRPVWNRYRKHNKVWQQHNIFIHRVEWR